MIEPEGRRCSSTYSLGGYPIRTHEMETDISFTLSLSLYLGVRPASIVISSQLQTLISLWKGKHSRRGGSRGRNGEGEGEWKVEGREGSGDLMRNRASSGYGWS